jgi:hypothetical protein
MAKAQTIELRLLGQKIALRTSDTDPRRVQEVVDLVSTKLKLAEKRAPKGIAPHQLTLLALLDLAEDHLRARERTVEFKKKVDERSSSLLDLIEAESR